MVSRSLVVKSLAVAICSGLVFASGTGVVAATTATGKSNKVPSGVSKTDSDCVGPSAFKSIAYKVDGKVVPTLMHKVSQGSKIEIAFELKDSCDGTPVGIAGYEAKSDHGNTEPFAWQKLVTQQGGTYTAGAQHQISLDTPGCYFQVDFYTGAAAEPGDYYSPSGRLVSTDVGGDKACADVVSGGVSGGNQGTGGQPAPTTTSTTAPTTTTPPKSGSYICPAKAADQISDYWVEINGNKYSKLTSVKPGDTVTVHFTLNNGCKRELTFASYKAKSLDNSPLGVLSQTLHDYETQWFTPGTHSLTVDVPECMYQVDFVEGKVIQKFGPVGSGNYYAGRIIDAALGGTTQCEETAPTSTSPSSTLPGATTSTTIQGGSTSTTSTTTPSTSTTSTSILGGSTSTTSTTVAPTTSTSIQGAVTTVPSGGSTSTTIAGAVTSTTTTLPEYGAEQVTTTLPSVKGVSQENTQGQASDVDATEEEVDAANLAATGMTAAPLVLLGAMLLGAGVFLLVSSRRMATR